jgi:hypothetical protein
MDLLDLVKLRSAMAIDAGRTGNLLVRTDLTGTYQLYELGAGDRQLRQITNLSEPVTGRYLPGTRSVIVQMDDGGNERHQLYRCDLDATTTDSVERLEPLALADGFAQPLIGVARDGGRIAYVSNRRNGIDFDVYVLDPRTRDETCVYDGGGWCRGSSGFSPSGRYLAFFLPGDRPLDECQMVADLDTGAIAEICPHPDAAASVGAPAWVDDSSFFASSNVGRDLAAIVHFDMTSGRSSTVLEDPHDLDCYASGDGSTLLVVANENGSAGAALFATGDAGSLTSLGAMTLPDRGVLDVYAGIGTPPLVSEDGSSVVFTFSSPRLPSEVWRFERGSSTLERLTYSSTLASEDAATLSMPTDHVVTGFDGEEVPLYLYMPPDHGTSSGPRPAVVMVHGGPEAQANLIFSPRTQALVGRGFAVVVPNVRGSTGYGKRYASLDDTVAARA